MKRTLILTTLLSLCCGGAQEQVEQAVAFSQIEKKVLIVISHENFRDEEFKEPYSLLVGSGVIVTIASTDTSTATGMLGMNVKPDIILEQVNPEDFDALVVVGGTGCRNLWNNTTLHNIIQSFNITKKTIAAICIGPVVLGKAGILEGMNATVHASAKDEFDACGAHYTGADVEVSGHIITSSGPLVAKDFAAAVLKAISQ